MDLLQSLSTQSLQTTYTYEPHRNLKTRVQNNVNSNTLSQYAYDLSGRRILVANTGAAFAQAEQRGYLYDPIGNRTHAETAGAAIEYTANTVNQ